MASYGRGALVCCAVLMSEVVASAEDIDFALRDRFLKAVRENVWNSEKVSFRAKCVSTRDYPTRTDAERAKLRANKIDPETKETVILQCAFRGPLALMTGVDRNIEFVRSKNSEYAFQINRDSAAKAYSLSFIEQLRHPSLADLKIQYAENEARAFPFGGWYFLGEPVANIVENPSFQIKRVGIENREGAELVRIEFDRKYSDPKQRGYSYSDAFMLCDPERHWAMVEYGMTSFDGLITARTALAFGEVVNGLPIPKSITHISSRKDDDGEPLIWRQVIEIEVAAEEVPKEEFYLSHYGLPEPNFRRGWFGVWVWYLLAGIGCLGAAMVVARRKKTSLHR